jgi:hypothetical protein
MKEIMSGMDSSDVREIRAYRIDALIELLLDISHEKNNLSQNAGLWVHAQKFFDDAQECDEILDTLR